LILLEYIDNQETAHNTRLAQKCLFGAFFGSAKHRLPALQTCGLLIRAVKPSPLYHDVRVALEISLTADDFYQQRRSAPRTEHYGSGGRTRWRWG